MNNLPDSLNPEFNPELNPIQVEMEEWKKGQGSDLLWTRGLGPCIGVGLHLPDEEMSFLVHDLSPSSGASFLESMLQNTKKYGFGAPELTALTGGYIDEEDDVAAALGSADREAALRLLDEAGIEVTEDAVKWVERTTEMASIVMHSGTGETHVEIEEL